MKTFFRAIGILSGLVAVTSGQLVREANTTLTLSPDLPTATTFVTQNALGTLTFTLPMCTAFPAGETNRLFVAQRGSGSVAGGNLVPGTIQVVSNLSTTPVKAQYLSLSSLLAGGEILRTDGENGFLSFVFHPNFATNGTLFVYFSMEAGGQLHQRLHKVVVTNPSANVATIASHTRMLTIVDRETNHNGGDLHFGADGYLYLSMGDEGGGGDNRNNARFINQQLDPVGTPNRVTRTGFWGQIHRFDVDNRSQSLAPNPHVQNSTTFPSGVEAGTYKIPADNPFIGYTRWHSLTIDPATVRTEIYATGLRNPFRFSFDAPTGRLFLADVGQNIWEEVDLIVKGGDYGWSWREGDHVYNTPPAPTAPGPALPGDPPGTGFNPIAPIFEYDHTNSGAGDIFGTSITGGMVMRGDRLPELFGAYIYADFNSAQIVALRQNGASWTGQIIASDTQIVDFGLDPRNDDLLLCDLSSGEIRRLARSVTSGTPPPTLLSATGAFSNLANLTPNAGIVAYDPIADLWSDYASKLRWFSIKNLTDKVTFSTEGNWAFPTGMVWVKHFDIETARGNPATKRKLETRFLVKTANDIYGLSYRWRADQTDADLVAEEGLSEVIPGSSPAQAWRFPSRSECRACHNSLAGFALSFHTRQLNRDHTYGALSQNQIAALSAAGYFSAPVANVNNLPAFSAPGDPTKSLESRVRAYLSVNCVHCHQPNGNATGTWDARITTPTDSANLINGALVNSFGDLDDRFAVPGAPANSMVLKRLQGLGVPRMPPLLTTERDLVSEQLVTEWINSLSTRKSFTQWQDFHFGSPGAPEAAPTADPDLDGQNNKLEFLQATLPTVIGLPILPGVTLANGEIQISFTHPANRSVVVETSTNLTSWSLWDVPGNRPFFPAADTSRTLTGPKDAPNRHFRLKLGEQ